MSKVHVMDSKDKKEIKEEVVVVEESEESKEESAKLRSECEALIKGTAFSKALETALTTTVKNPEAKKTADKLALQAMDSIKPDDITKFVDSANDALLDAVMRVVYQGMGNGQNCANLLQWHAKISDKAGIGCIMRAMTYGITVGK